MKRKITLCILLILIIMCVTLLSYEKINKAKLSNDTGMFAIFLEEEKDSGKYQKSNLKTWPTEEEYTINMFKSYCENGSILRWNNVDKKISLKVTGTDKCYVYFDKAEIGSAKHPHLIQTIEDLVRLSNDVNGGKNYAGEYFLLTNDLDFNDPSDYENPESMEFGNINGINGDEALIKELTTGSGFVPIGRNGASFNGSFNGGNHRVDNLYINNNSTITERLGLFGQVLGSGLINNLTVSGKINSNTDAAIGGILGESWGNVIIENCHSEVNITSSSAGNLGGIIGSSGSFTIKKCTNKGNVTGGENVGGIIGYHNSILTIEDSINYGEITNNLGAYVGGLLGRGTNSTIINNSHNEGKIVQNTTSGNSRAGGLIAQIDGNAVIENSYNIGNIISDLSLYQTNQNMYGGLIGRKENSGNVIINNSYNKGNIEINGNSYTNIYIGGIIGDLYGDKNNGTFVYIINSYNTGNLKSIGNYRNSRKSGIIGEIYFSATAGIINSYNGGNITDTTSASTNVGIGLIMDNSNEAVNTIKLNNTFNLGEINCTDKWQIFSTLSIQDGKKANVEYNNVYYLDGLDATNRNEIIFASKTKATMQSQNFVDELNKNTESINLSEIDESLNSYTLSKWQLGSDGYPELINE